LVIFRLLGFFDLTGGRGLFFIKSTISAVALRLSQLRFEYLLGDNIVIIFSSVITRLITFLSYFWLKSKKEKVQPFILEKFLDLFFRVLIANSS
jgi:hypothetical protein